jgi:hypothetical protein
VSGGALPVADAGPDGSVFMMLTGGIDAADGKVIPADGCDAAGAWLAPVRAARVVQAAA